MRATKNFLHSVGWHGIFHFKVHFGFTADSAPSAVLHHKKYSRATLLPRVPLTRVDPHLWSLPESAPHIHQSCMRVANLSYKRFSRPCEEQQCTWMCFFVISGHTYLFFPALTQNQCQIVCKSQKLYPCGTLLVHNILLNFNLFRLFD